MGDLTESAKLRNAIKKIVKQVIDEEEKPCFRLYKAQITSAPNGTTCTVQLDGYTNTINLPYSSAVQYVNVGDMVWVATLYNSFSNAIVFCPINFELNNNDLNAHPVGNIYLSVNSTSPALLFGGTWEELPAGKVLQTIATTGTAGIEIAAGLPNITGKFGTGGSSALFFSAQTQGAFSNTDSGKRYNVDGTTSNYDRTSEITFDASRSNTIYGNSSTVQPPAYTIYAWRRVN